MRPLFHPHLVNGAEGDPALYIECLFERRALLFDLGDIHALANRKLLRLEHIFISHTHMDHFIGLDHLLRVCLGRERRIHLYGPPGLIAQTGHRLGGYSWNLVANYDSDLTFEVMEVDGSGHATVAEFHCREAFRESRRRVHSLDGDRLLETPAFRVRYAPLDHHIPSLAFALEESRHVNVWKDRLEARGLAVGGWLRELKEAVLTERDEATRLNVAWAPGQQGPARLPLGELRALVRTVPGQKIGYVVDAGATAENRERIVELVRNADLLFIEAAFADADRQRAVETRHLTAKEAGTLARDAGVRRLIPFHFSARYSGETEPLINEAFAAFRDDKG